MAGHFSYSLITLYSVCIVFFRNIPHIHVHQKRENRNKWHGAEIKVIIEGNWTTYRVSLLDNLMSSFIYVERYLHETIKHQSCYLKNVFWESNLHSSDGSPPAAIRDSWDHAYNPILESALLESEGGGCLVHAEHPNIPAAINWNTGRLGMER